MQCDYCDSKATVFFTQIIDGKMNKASLCETCANNQGVTDPEGFLLGNMDLSAPSSAPNPADTPELPMFEVPMGDKTIELPGHEPRSPSGTGICPGCGFAFDDLKKTGRLGCSQCYQAFRAEIKHNLGNMHKGTSHTGRVPEGLLKLFELRQRTDQLTQELNEAVSAEDYEKAASLRDEINSLTDESNQPDPHTP